ncbi:helix-turn-helix transcriptional regulator [Pseudoclavibacter sp. JSM 162008]|uniref:helix-turn-helix domain-containing protein n=1 Tax=Pseudoclavibacter sp. JSM 162008 TaxID=3229855 RepID=UPI0035231C1E
MSSTATTPGAGAALRNLREGTGLQLTAVASAAQTPPSYLSEVETGKRKPSTVYVARVTEAITTLLRQQMASEQPVRISPGLTRKESA